jgi:hypothetical protein
MDLPGASPSPAFRITPQLVVGLVIIFVGVVFTLEELGIVPAAIVLRFWPSALIAIGVVKMLAARDGGGALAGLLFTLVGVWLQAEELDLIRIPLWQIWPLALVLFGGYLVWRGLSPCAPKQRHLEAPAVPFPEAERATQTTEWSGETPAGVKDANATMSTVAILGGVSRGNNSRAFRGADVLAIMGGVQLDLRRAAIHGEAVIDVFVMWGGIEIRVPEDWTVVSHIVPVMAGVDDKTRPPHGATAHRLVLRGFALMGGVEIKN